MKETTIQLAHFFKKDFLEIAKTIFPTGIATTCSSFEASILSGCPFIK